MKITSKEAIINAKCDQVFQFLSDCQNIYHILPQDKITDWKSSQDECSFVVQKMATIPLIIVGRHANSLLEMKSGDRAPFPFKLNVVIEDCGEITKSHIDFDGEINAFLKMMVEKPLTNLFDYMVHQLQAHFNKP